MTNTVLQTFTEMYPSKNKKCINSLRCLHYAGCTVHCQIDIYYFATQERLVLSILPRFVALEMIADMSSLEDELSPHEFHKIYIHQYKDVRYTCIMLLC